jgi:hypothetical protein
MRWQPTEAAARAVVDYVASLFDGPSDHVDCVESEFYDRLTLIDAGENTSTVICPECATDLGVVWLFDFVAENGISYDTLDVVVPCCDRTVGLDRLHCDWPIGFARFEVAAINARRDGYELDEAEVATVVTLLGHPITQILAHY